MEAIPATQSNQMLLFGSLAILAVIFFIGILINVPAAIVCVRSRHIRGFTDKFTLFVLAVDIFSLLTLLPVSFFYLFESNAYNDTAFSQYVNVQDDRPIFKDGESYRQDRASSNPNFEDKFSSHCVHQWILIIRKFVFQMAANLSVLGATKIALERYLAVVTPLHYHRFLKSSYIICMSFTSVLVSVISSIIFMFDPDDFPTSIWDNQCYSNVITPTLSRSFVSRQAQAISLQFRSQDANDGSLENSKLIHESQVTPSSVWWPVLKLAHTTVFFILPLAVIIFMYLRICSEAKRQNAKMSHFNKGQFIFPVDAVKSEDLNVDGLQCVFRKFKLVPQLKRRAAQVNRASTVAMLTIGLLLLCFGPFYYEELRSAISLLMGSPFYIWDLRKKHEDADTINVHIMPTLLACFHPLLSPLVYVYRYKKIRGELMSLMKKMISKINCFCHEKHGPTECQDIVQQINDLAESLPMPSCAEANNTLESQIMSTVPSESMIAVNMNGSCSCVPDPEHSRESALIECPNSEKPESFTPVHPPADELQDDFERQEYSESDIENQDFVGENQVISSLQSKKSLFKFVNCWMNSYARRWGQHRESVTSTASFITLLSNRSRRSVPSSII